MARKKKQVKIEKNKQSQVPIAIVGLAGIFPGAENVDAYWENILHKVDSVMDVPPSRWRIDDYYDPDPAAPDKTYARRGGFIPDIAFDPMQFGLPPNILEVTDVSQLLSLVVAQEALADAGYRDSDWEGRARTGVILGAVGMSSKLFTPLMTRLQYPVWEKVLRSFDISAADTRRIVEKMKLAYVQWDTNAFPGTLSNVISGRIANRMDLGGTNCVIDAACASSLAALKMSVAELSSGQADMMISGGVDLDNSINTFMCFSKTPAFTSGDRVRTFDAESDGMMAGEGIGMLVMKRLEDAERDQDRIYAVIRSIGSSSDGRHKSIYAPRSAGQAISVRRAYAQAGIEPHSVRLIEAHGTGTAAGDPAEFAGLLEAFGDDPQFRQKIALGSIKSQIAHTKAAAGAAGLIKTALALYEKILPATINVKNPSPKMNITESSFYINSETRPWLQAAEGTPRRAGVSAFGFGGTNFHVVMEEYDTEHVHVYRTRAVPFALLLSAPDRTELLSRCQLVLTELQSADGEATFMELVETARKLEIPARHARVGWLAANPVEAANQLLKAITQFQQAAVLENWDLPEGISFRTSALNESEKVVALFPGQGSQYLNMGLELGLNYPPIRKACAEMDQVLHAEGEQPLSEVVFPVPAFDRQTLRAQREKLKQTEFAQPAIGTFSYGLMGMLKTAGFNPDMVVGHSFGELTALWAAGVIDAGDYLRLARLRGKAMAPVSEKGFDPGTMMAVKADGEKVSKEIEAFPDVIIANWNAPNQVVLAGPTAAMKEAGELLKGKGYTVIPLQVSAAFHTSLVAHAQKAFEQALQDVKFNQPECPVLSNAAADFYAHQTEKIQQTLAAQILSPVKFCAGIERMHAEGGRIFVEIGPGAVLSRLVDEILSDRPHTCISLNPDKSGDSDRQYRHAALKLRVLGILSGDLDPYGRPRESRADADEAKMKIMLNGGEYVSEPTRRKFEDALNAGDRLSSASQTAVEPATLMAPKETISQSTSDPAEAMPAEPGQSREIDPGFNMPDSFEAELANQHSILGVQEQYLQLEQEYVRAIAEILDQRMKILTQALEKGTSLDTMLPLLDGLDKRTQQLQGQHHDTGYIHAEFLKTIAQNGYTEPVMRSSFPAAQMEVPAPVIRQSMQASSEKQSETAVPTVPEPQPVMAGAGIKPSGLDAAAAEQLLLSVVSEKTGYPVEMLEPGMDMEADLGIDSIKRVEIMAAVQDQVPAMPELDTEALAEMRTLEQVRDYMLVSAPAAETPPQPIAVAKDPVSKPAAAATPGLDAAAAEQLLLTVVSEKTGYPVEMLEPGMDMEADLGIDSIKRVEIMAAVQDQVPAMPELDTEALAEMRTLEQVRDYMLASAPAVETPPQPIAVAKDPVSKPVTTATSGLDAAAAEQLLLSVVSEKTGYPVEMLEPGMDMEADLGIDSIKRVEIMAAVQDQVPAMPELDTEALADMRTLEQVRDYMLASAPVGTGADALADSAVIATAATPEQESSLQMQPVVVKELAPPDKLKLPFEYQPTCLLVSEGSEFTHAAVAALSAAGWKPVVLLFPDDVIPVIKDLPAGTQEIQLDDMSDAGISSALEQFLAQNSVLNAFIHLHPIFPVENGGKATSSVILEEIFILSGKLKAMLQQAAADGFGRFMTVTRMDGVLGMTGGPDPVAGGLMGLVKTLSREWPQVSCRALDLSVDLPLEAASDTIIAEMLDPDRSLIEVGVSASARVTLTTGPVLLENAK